MTTDQRLWIATIVLTWIVLALLGRLEAKWVPIYPGSGEEPADHKEVPARDEDEE